MTKIISLITACLCLVACQSQMHDNSQKNSYVSAANKSESVSQKRNSQRIHYLVDAMQASPLKNKLSACLSESKNLESHPFSIAHRGAPLHFAEHTRESYLEGMRQGALKNECDIAFTKDKELVCRHSQCDLHSTTNILQTALAKQCSEPFKAASNSQAASAKCCTSDITLAQYRSLQGRQDTVNAQAQTVEEYLSNSQHTGQLFTHKESIQLFKQAKKQFVPELKSLDSTFFANFTKQDFVNRVIAEYQELDIDPKDVFIQTADLEVAQLLLASGSPYAQQLVMLDFNVTNDAETIPSPTEFKQLKASGINTIAPPLFALLSLDENNNIVPSEYVRRAKTANLDIVTWTVERSGHLINDMKKGSGSKYYYQSILPAIESDGDVFTVIDVLAKDVGVVGIFSDWPETVTFYANCVK